ncbi:MAG: chorismate mutase [Peptococcaceae bacterium]|nr:chorismate mutase [Peptococcaceae bacterium]
MDLQELRQRIDGIDDELVKLFGQRMDVSAEIAQHKRQNNIPVFDPERERQKLYEVSGKVSEGREAYVTALYSMLFDLSRADQERILSPASELTDMIQNAIRGTEWMLPERTVVACQGTEGAYSQLAAETLFPLPSILYFNTFDGVFSAVDSGLCAYGVLPLENSTAGSINQVYDLMMRYPFSIVRSVRLKIDHTRFICVSKSLAIYPGADKTSLMMTIPHKPGSLYRILSRFYIHGVNLVKLESRPIPNRDFEFMFYFDLVTPVYSPSLMQALRELNELCDEFRYLGSYSEVV